MNEHCAICGCSLHRTKNTYAKPTGQGRSHATRHHFVAERFFGRSANRKETKSLGVFDDCPWGMEGKSEVFCYECHEELLHNPVVLPTDITRLAAIVAARGLNEEHKTEDRSKLAGRIKLFHEVIQQGIAQLAMEQLSMRDESYPAYNMSHLIQRVPLEKASNIRRDWTGNDESARNHNGKVSLSENPLRLRLSWKKGPKHSVHLVGIYDIYIKQLLKAGYIRYEPNSESKVRLRFYHGLDNVVYIQMNSQGQGLPIGTAP